MGDFPALPQGKYRESVLDFLELHPLTLPEFPPGLLDAAQEPGIVLQFVIEPIILGLLVPHSG